MKEVEVLDFDNNSKKGNRSRVTRRRKLKGNRFQRWFCLISFLFIVGCCVFYGQRLIKYYKIYNPKAENGAKADLISSNIAGKSKIVYEGDGLYRISGNYTYKGDVDNNYIRFSNMLWRIVRINKDETMELILDDYINLLNWNNETVSFDESSIYKYLNNYFVNGLNTNLLIKSSICTDVINDFASITCDDVVTNYVKLLDVSSFLNTLIDNDTYLTTNDEIMWLNNYNDENIWHTNGSNVSKSSGNNFYEIRPVVTLTSTAILYDGDGTKENPYIVEKDNKTFEVGNYVKIKDDIWVIYEKNNNFMRLSSSRLFDKQSKYSSMALKFDPFDDNSIASYLNNDYLNNLSYKKLLQNVDWYIGKMDTSYENVKNSKIKAKVGLLNMMDIKIDSHLENYFLSTYNDKYIYAYGSIIKESEPTIYKNIRPCIALKTNLEIKEGNGTISEPYVVEE